MLAETSDKLRDRSDQCEEKIPKLGQIRRRTARILEQIEQEKKDQKLIVTQIECLSSKRDQAIKQAFKRKLSENNT